MATILTHNDNRVKNYQHQPTLKDGQLTVAYIEEEKTNLDGMTQIESTEKASIIKRLEASVSTRQRPSVSLVTSTASSNKSTSNAYKYVQLERALTSANLLNKKDDRIKFENEYLTSMRTNTFDKFVDNYYQKIFDHNESIKREQELKTMRTFTIIDLEKNFLALDPTRDIKIVFVDEPANSTITKTTNTRSSISTNQSSASSFISNDANVELFYTTHARRFLSDPSWARDKITKFTQQTGEELLKRLPRLSTVPHRVKIVDERDTSGKPNEYTLLQMKHKRALSLINKRRHLIIKMITQTKKNQNKTEQYRKNAPVITDSSALCRELLERANQIEQDDRAEQSQRPPTAMVPRRISTKNISFASGNTTTNNTNTTPPLSSCSTPFQDALSITQVEKSKNVRVLLPTRPFTAPTKANWVNYC